MQVTHVISNLGPGGAETSLFRLLRALARSNANHSVISMTQGGWYTERLRALGVEVEELNAAPRFSSLTQLPNLANSLRRTRPDIVQGWMYHGNTLATLGRAMVARNAKVCWNVRQTSASLKDDKFLTRSLILVGAPLSRFCSRIIYNSPLAAAQHERYGYLARKRRVIANGIDCHEFKPDPAGRKRLCALFNLPADAVIIGRFGRKAPMKDNRTMLAAFSLLAAQDQRRHLVVIGPTIDNNGAELERWAQQTGAGGRIHFLGTRADLTELMAGADVNVSSSKSSEGFPNVIAEGMACAVPTVATDVGESSLIIGDPSRIVRPGDPVALAAAIGAVLALPDQQRWAMGARDRARISALFSIPAMVDGYLTTWQECLA